MSDYKAYSMRSIYNFVFWSETLQFSFIHGRKIRDKIRGKTEQRSVFLIDGDSIKLTQSYREGKTDLVVYRKCAESLHTKLMRAHFPDKDICIETFQTILEERDRNLIYRNNQMKNYITLYVYDRAKYWQSAYSNRHVMVQKSNRSTGSVILIF